MLHRGQLMEIMKELKNYDIELTRNKLINYENSMNQKVNSFFKKWKDT